MNIFLKLKIIERFVTQADFAQNMGVDESIVSRVIRGRRQLNWEDKKKWAKSLGCSPQKLFED